MWGRRWLSTSVRCGKFWSDLKSFRKFDYVFVKTGKKNCWNFVLILHSAQSDSTRRIWPHAVRQHLIRPHQYVNLHFIPCVTSDRARSWDCARPRPCGRLRQCAQAFIGRTVYVYQCNPHLHRREFLLKTRLSVVFLFRDLKKKKKKRKETIMQINRRAYKKSVHKFVCSPSIVEPVVTWLFCFLAFLFGSLICLFQLFHCILHALRLWMEAKFLSLFDLPKRLPNFSAIVTNLRSLRLLYICGC